MTKVNASICPNCLDLIFSRAHHDLHHCSCKEIYTDGGFEYTRGGWTNEFPYQIIYEVEQSKDELYKDYNLMVDQFGIVKDWKMSILDFFNVQDSRCTAALKAHIKSNLWPKNFPVEHLTFPDSWCSILMSRVLTFFSEEKEK